MPCRGVKAGRSAQLENTQRIGPYGRHSGVSNRCRIRYSIVSTVSKQFPHRRRHAWIRGYRSGCAYLPASREAPTPSSPPAQLPPRVDWIRSRSSLNNFVAAYPLRVRGAGSVPFYAREHWTRPACSVASQKRVGHGQPARPASPPFTPVAAPCPERGDFRHPPSAPSTRGSLGPRRSRASGHCEHTQGAWTTLPEGGGSSSAW
jgi:hypothetical protein